MNLRITLLLLLIFDSALGSKKGSRAPRSSNTTKKRVTRPVSTGVVVFREDETGVHLEIVSPHKVSSRLRKRIHAAIEKLSQNSKLSPLTIQDSQGYLTTWPTLSVSPVGSEPSLTTGLPGGSTLHALTGAAVLSGSLSARIVPHGQSSTDISRNTDLSAISPNERTWMTSDAPLEIRSHVDLLEVLKSRSNWVPEEERVHSTPAVTYEPDVRKSDLEPSRPDESQQTVTTVEATTVISTEAVKSIHESYHTASMKTITPRSDSVTSYPTISISSSQAQTQRTNRLAGGANRRRHDAAAEADTNGSDAFTSTWSILTLLILQAYWGR